MQPTQPLQLQNYTTLLFMTALTVINIVAQNKSRGRGEAPPPTQRVVGDATPDIKGGGL